MVDPDEVRRVAELARLGLDPDEEAALAGELVAILAHFESLQEVDTEGVEPLSHPLDSRGRPQADQIEAFDSPRDTLLNLTEHSREGFFVVPRILGDDEHDELPEAPTGADPADESDSEG